MKRILFDQNTPIALQRSLVGHIAHSAREMGWETLVNGDLLRAAENERFDILITADQRLRYQQNLTGRRLALVVLSTNRLASLLPSTNRIVEAVNTVATGGYVTLRFERPVLIRRPPPGYQPS